MKRKLIQQGLGGRTVFLPIAWVRDNNLSVGDEVEISYAGKDILISSSKKSSIKQKELTLDHPLSSGLLRTIISSCYKAGYTDLIVNSESLPSVKNVHDIISSFTGMEIISYSSKSIRLKTFIQQDDTEIENLIIKLFQMLKTMADEILFNWENPDIQKVTYMLEMSLRKLRDLILRSIHSTRFGDDKTYDYYEFVTLLEKIAGEWLEIARYISGNNPVRSAKIDSLVLLLNDFYSVFLKKDYTQAHKLWLKVGALKNETLTHDQIAKVLKEEDPGLVMHYHLQRWLYKHLASRLVSICRY